MRILVAEDDVIARKRLTRHLKEWGHEVIDAADGGSALEMFISQTPLPDMVITDWLMPELTGVELAKHIRTCTRGKSYTYIILLTSLTERENIITGFKEGGVDDYIHKPFDITELEARLQVGVRVVNLEKAQRDYSLSLEHVVRRQTLKIRETQEEIVVRLFSALECRDEETGDHVRRISLISAFLAEQLGCPQTFVDDIRYAAPMHDIGKIGIPDGILRKPGRLTREEFEVIKTHPGIGARILQNSQYDQIRVAEEIALRHHEKWDGTGYPDGLSGEAIPLSAQIVAVADVFDAMANDRVYRPAMAEGEVLRIMREGRGKHFSPTVLDLFLEHFCTIQRIKAEIVSPAGT